MHGKFAELFFICQPALQADFPNLSTKPSLFMVYNSVQIITQNGSIPPKVMIVTKKMPHLKIIEIS